MNRGSQANTYVRANGDGPTATFRRFNVSEGRVIQGTVGDPNDAPNFICTDFCVGVDTVNGKNCEYVMNNGTMTLSACYINYYHGSAPAVCTGKLTVNGGTVDVGNTLALCNDVNSTGRLFLNGGSIAASAITLNNGKAYITFNGGTLGLKGSGTLPALSGTYVSTNGATISVSIDVTYTIDQALVRDPLLQSAADGGFTKTGPGMLVLSGANTFTGPTTIAGGVLRATRDDALSDHVSMSVNGALDCAGGTLTVGEIEMRGVVQNGTLRVAGALVADLSRDLFMNVEGDIEVAAGTKLDLGTPSDENLPFGLYIPLATVSGTVSAPERVQVINGGSAVQAAKLVVEDGMLYAVTASSGTVMIIR